jgi:predicted nucleic acid binding AN1-type Zn finger protein
MKCRYCKKKVGITTLDCKYCGLSFCTSCITLEKHNCDGLDDYIDKNKKDLEDKLKSAVTSKSEKMNV